MQCNIASCNATFLSIPLQSLFHSSDQRRSLVHAPAPCPQPKQPHPIHFLAPIQLSIKLYVLWSILITFYNSSSKAIIYKLLVSHPRETTKYMWAGGYYYYLECYYCILIHSQLAGRLAIFIGTVRQEIFGSKNFMDSQ